MKKLPPTKSEYETLAMEALTRFTGDPAFYQRNSEENEAVPEDDDEQKESQKNQINDAFREVDRLAVIVRVCLC